MATEVLNNPRPATTAIGDKDLDELGEGGGYAKVASTCPAYASCRELGD
jgi:hypothetical protein